MGLEGWFNPDDWMDVFDHVLLIVGACAVAGLPSWLAIRNHRSLRGLTDQVKNGHTTPLRADLDDMREMMTDAFRELRFLRDDISGLRGEVRDERRDRTDLEKRVQDFVKREHPGSGPV